MKRYCTVKEFRNVLDVINKFVSDQKQAIEFSQSKKNLFFKVDDDKLLEMNAYLNIGLNAKSLLESLIQDAEYFEEFEIFFNIDCEFINENDDKE